ncbi:MAG: sel1 repeat family protein, partial [Paludibacteraceae bacterium]|nr:sel1 repeat family protein [Paludibacteraceae bacterium]
MNKSGRSPVRAARGSTRAITAALAFLLATAFLPAFADEAQDEYKLGKQAFDTKQYEAAAEHYGKAAELGHSGGQNALGYCYEYGLGLRKDYAKAVEWYRKAAEQGDAKAQFNLGLCYDFGRGVTEDAAEAVEWYRKAAEQGDAKAQYNLGICYDSGRGVEADEAEAEKWLRLAADQGHPDARHYFKYRWFRRFRERHDMIFELTLKLVILSWFFLINVCILSFVAKVATFFGKK